MVWCGAQESIRLKSNSWCFLYALKLEVFRKSYWKERSPGWVAQLIGASLCTPKKGWGFDSWSRHIPKLQVRYPVRAVWVANNQCFSLSLASLSYSRSLSPPSSLFETNKKHIFGWVLKKEKEKKCRWSEFSCANFAWKITMCSTCTRLFLLVLKFMVLVRNLENIFPGKVYNKYICLLWIITAYFPTLNKEIKSLSQKQNKQWNATDLPIC